jgi:signal transduction histidine kinase
VITVLDQGEALRILDQTRVDLLLAGLCMPGMENFELVRRAKQAQPGLPVMVMAGSESIGPAIDALHRGVDGLLLKPLSNPFELSRAVEQLIEESHQKRDAASLQALRPLFAVIEVLLAETSQQKLEDFFLASVKDLFSASWVGIHLVTGGGRSLSPLRVSEPGTARTGQIEEIIRSLSVGEGPVLVRGRSLAGKDEAPQLLRQAGLGAMLVAPVQRNQLFVFSAARECSQADFTHTELEMFSLLTRQAAVALENAWLYAELNETIRRVEDSRHALVQVEKMAAVGRLVASMAHEINNPLQAVRNCLHLATRKGASGEQQGRYLEMMDIELERLVQTVRQMLDFYRTGSADRETVEISQVVRQVLDLLKPQFRDYKIEVNYNQPSQPGLVTILPGQIQQVLFNLLINSMDAIGSVCDKPDSKGKKRTIWLDVYLTGEKVCVRVEDSGDGIPVELREQVFEPFVSTKQNGTGLGLAVSYGIMERNQGELSLVSPRHGDGACFELSLPQGGERNNGKGFNC